MEYSIELSEEEIERVVLFCQQVQVSPRMFGQSDSNRRNKDRMFMDMLVGKTGEVAFQKFLLREFNIDVPLDWEIYSREIGDKQDFVIFNHRFEVKSIKNGDWFLIEQERLTHRKRDGLVPHYFVLVRVPFDEEKNRPRNRAYIKGYCSLEQLAHPSNLLLKGNELPNKRVKLEATNFGLHTEKLHSNWAVLFFQIEDIQKTYEETLTSIS